MHGKVSALSLSVKRDENVFLGAREIRRAESREYGGGVERDAEIRLGSEKKTGKAAADSRVLKDRPTLADFDIGKGAALVAGVRAGQSREPIGADATAGVVGHDTAATIAAKSLFLATRQTGGPVTRSGKHNQGDGDHDGGSNQEHDQGQREHKDPHRHAAAFACLGLVQSALVDGLERWRSLGLGRALGHG